MALTPGCICDYEISGFDPDIVENLSGTCIIRNITYDTLSKCNIYVIENVLNSQVFVVFEQDIQFTNVKAAK